MELAFLRNIATDPELNQSKGKELVLALSAAPGQRTNDFVFEKGSTGISKGATRDTYIHPTSSPSLERGTSSTPIAEPRGRSPIPKEAPTAPSPSEELSKSPSNTSKAGRPTSKSIKPTPPVDEDDPFLLLDAHNTTPKEMPTPTPTVEEKPKGDAQKQEDAQKEYAQQDGSVVVPMETKTTTTERKQPMEEGDVTDTRITEMVLEDLGFGVRVRGQEKDEVLLEEGEGHPMAVQKTTTTEQDVTMAEEEVVERTDVSMVDTESAMNDVKDVVASLAVEDADQEESTAAAPLKVAEATNVAGADPQTTKQSTSSSAVTKRRNYEALVKHFAARGVPRPQQDEAT
ncbi:unnamed protein product, partial [Amoebophrya sp. A25]|eukprot:GSA25T00008525001.1